MSWEQIDDKHKKKYDRNFVACDETYERKYIIDTILEHFPSYKRSDVENAVDHCCKSIKAPRDRKTFLKCVKDYLDK